MSEPKLATWVRQFLRPGDDAERAADQQILRFAEVRARVKLSRSTILALLAENSFPRPFRLSRRIVAWRAGDIAKWLDERPAVGAKSNAGAGHDRGGAP